MTDDEFQDLWEQSDSEATKLVTKDGMISDYVKLTVQLFLRKVFVVKPPKPSFLGLSWEISENRNTLSRDIAFTLNCPVCRLDGIFEDVFPTTDEPYHREFGCSTDGCGAWFFITNPNPRLSAPGGILRPGYPFGAAWLPSKPEGDRDGG